MVTFNEDFIAGRLADHRRRRFSTFAAQAREIREHLEFVYSICQHVECKGRIDLLTRRLDKLEREFWSIQERHEPQSKAAAV